MTFVCILTFSLLSTTRASLLHVVRPFSRKRKCPYLGRQTAASSIGRRQRTQSSFKADPRVFRPQYAWTNPPPSPLSRPQRRSPSILSLLPCPNYNRKLLSLALIILYCSPPRHRPRMPSIPHTNSDQAPMESTLERRENEDTVLYTPSRTPVEASTVIAVIFGFAAIVIIAASACIIFYHRRTQKPSGNPKTTIRWGRTLVDADRQPDSITKEAEQSLGTKQVPMLQPMAFLQGREGPKEFVGGGRKRRSSGLPRLIADGMGGLWPRRHSVWTLNSSHTTGEDGEEQGGTSSRPVSKRSHRSRPSSRSSRATISRKNGSNLSTSSAKLTTTVQMDRTIAKKPSITGTEVSPSLSAPPSAFSAPRLSRNTSASTSGVPSSYKKSRLRSVHQGDSFLEHDIREDDLQTNYRVSAGSTAPSLILNPVDLAAFPVPPLPALNVRNNVNDH